MAETAGDSGTFFVGNLAGFLPGWWPYGIGKVRG
jgi:hypothetical protein